MRRSRFPGRPGQHYLIGMLHLPPLFSLREGSEALSRAIGRAEADARALAEAGFDAVMVENFGDRPFCPERVATHTVAAMTRVVVSVERVLAELGAELEIGVNVLRNDALAALAIAAATGARMVRVNVHSGAMVTDQGLIQGRAHESVPYRDAFAPECAILADVRVKHAAPLVERPIAEEAEELWQRAAADAVIVSGSATGRPVALDDLQAVRQAISDCPLLIGSGATPKRLPEILPHVDGLIVGSYLKGGRNPDNPVDAQRARQFVQAVRAFPRSSV